MKSTTRSAASGAFSDQSNTFESYIRQKQMSLPTIVRSNACTDFGDYYWTNPSESLRVAPNPWKHMIVSWKWTCNIGTITGNCYCLARTQCRPRWKYWHHVRCTTGTETHASAEQLPVCSRLVKFKMLIAERKCRRKHNLWNNYIDCFVWPAIYSGYYSDSHPLFNIADSSVTKFYMILIKINKWHKATAAVTS